MKDQKIKRAHILLVEDNEGDILLTIEAFEECKIKSKISVARNGQEALDFVFRKGAFSDVEKPDLILLDINLPKFNGHEVLRQIKTNPELRRTPVIMLTTSDNKKDISEAYENHCNSYITKPLNHDDFLNAIMEIDAFWLQLSKVAE
jgi:CheY-like chemotaxis protein